jgi:hypothetical protein
MFENTGLRILNFSFVDSEYPGLRIPNIQDCESWIFRITNPEYSGFWILNIQDSWIFRILNPEYSGFLNIQDLESWIFRIENPEYSALRILSFRTHVRASWRVPEVHPGRHMPDHHRKDIIYAMSAILNIQDYQSWIFRITNPQYSGLPILNIQDCRSCIFWIAQSQILAGSGTLNIQDLQSWIFKIQGGSYLTGTPYFLELRVSIFLQVGASSCPAPKGVGHKLNHPL